MPIVHWCLCCPTDLSIIDPPMLRLTFLASSLSVVSKTPFLSLSLAIPSVPFSFYHFFSLSLCERVFLCVWGISPLSISFSTSGALFFLTRSPRHTHCLLPRSPWSFCTVVGKVLFFFVCVLLFVLCFTVQPCVPHWLVSKGRPLFFFLWYPSNEQKVI